MYVALPVKYPLFLWDFNKTLIFWTDFGKQISDFINVRSVGGELFHADGRTEMTKLVVDIRNFVNVPNKGHQRNKYKTFLWQSLPQWPRGLRHGSVAVRLLGLRVRIPPAKWTSVSCECCVLSGRGLCLSLIPLPEESYRVWCFCVWSWSLDNEETLAH
jgi:hypothetical protein